MIKIVILDKGFVSVGVYTQGPDWCSLDNAAVIRRWGTTRGLGQIAADGPTSSTVLDKSPKQTFPRHAIINTFECDDAKWEAALGVTEDEPKKKKKA